MTGRLARWLVRSSVTRPALVLGGWLALALAGAAGVGRVEVETSTASVLNRTDAAWTFYEHSQRLFGEDEVIVVALEGERPYDVEILAELHRLTRAFEKIPGVRRVDSLATVSLIRASSDGSLSLDPPLATGPPSTRAEAAHIAGLVERDRIAPRSLVSDDGRVFAINVLVEDDAEPLYPEMIRSIRETLDGRRARVSGVPVFRVETDARTRREVLLFVPLTLIVIGALLLFVFRSFSPVGIALGTSAIGAWILVAVMGLLGAPITITTAILPSVLLALGCAYVMHLLTAAAGSADRTELARALDEIAAPVALSGLTTAVGFAAVASVPIDSIRYVGGFGAIGVLIVVTASLTAAPAALAVWPPRRGSMAWEQRLRGRVLPRLVAVAEHRSNAVLAMWLLVGAAAALGASRVAVATDVTRWFPKGMEVRDSWDAIGRRLSGLTPLNVVIEAHDGGSVLEPRVLRAIDALSDHLGRSAPVGKSISLADPLRQLHGGFTGDPDQPLPLGEDLCEQYLLLLESVEQMGDVVTDQREAANILLRVDDNASDAIRELAARVAGWWRRHGADGFSARTTGTMFEFARSEDAIALGQLEGLFYAVGGIGAVLLAVFRKPLVVGTALLGNIAPVALLFGFMGLVGIPLDAGTVLVGSLALGIAVDDTLHVVSHFHGERARGAQHRAALVSAYRRVLPPLVYTTLAVSLGFAVLALSPFTFTRNLGLLTAAVMAICLWADVTLLPALLLRLDRKPAEPARSEP